MWSYYGAKTKIVKHYPAPILDVIIEPFAGTAAYSLFQDNWQKDVILVDKYDVIARVWKYLQQSRPEDIINLPDVQKGDNINIHKQLISEEKWLMGFCIHRGSESPRKTATDYNSWNKNKVTIANNLYKIRHWNIFCGDYRQVINIKATWFIDAPYQNGGQYYKHNDIDFKELGSWCMSRRGQVIVCENTKATWLPFAPLANNYGQCHKTTESIFYLENTVPQEQIGVRM